MGRAWLRPGRTPCVLATLLLAVCCHGGLAFDPSVWTLPPGFQVAEYFDGEVPKARQLAVSGASTAKGPVITYVGALSFDEEPMSIRALVDESGSGRADYMVTIVENLSAMPNGVAWRNGALYIASLEPGKTCTIYRLDNVDKYALDKKTAALSDLKVVLDSLPFNMWHGWKYIQFGPDGKLYVPVGANCNVCRTDGEPPNDGYVDGKLIFTTQNAQNASFVSAPYQRDADSPVWRFGTIYRMNPDGSGIEPYATGVRNTVGFTWHPDTNQMYFTDNGRDDWGGADSELTQNNPDCELNYAPKPGLDFGFPFCHTWPEGNDPDANPYLRSPGHGRNKVDPDLNQGEKAMKCNGKRAPFKGAIQALGPHVAPLGLKFYRWDASGQSQFPKSYDCSLLIAQRGSYNRDRKIGARVMRVVLDPDKPGTVLQYEPFLVGGVPRDIGLPTGPDPPVAQKAEFNGRPVDIGLLPDGSILVSDDWVSKVYRISYHGASGCHLKKRVRSRGRLPHDRHGRIIGSNDGCGFGTNAPLVVAEVVQGTRNGCKVYLGEGKGKPRYRRCLRFDMTGQRDFLTLAYSLQRLPGEGRVVMRGALLGHDYANMNGQGWMAFGLNSENRISMHGTNAILAQPQGAGATVQDYYLGGDFPSAFTKTQDFLHDGGDLMEAVMAGDALVTTFSIYLPRDLESDTTLSVILALGDLGRDGSLQPHWTTAVGQLKLKVRDIDRPGLSKVPVLNNRGMKGSPASSPGPSPPPSPKPPSPSPSSPGPSPPPTSNSPSPSPSPSPSSPSPSPFNCIVNGAAYDGCTETWGGGLRMTHYYTKSGSKLRGAIKADTRGLDGSDVGWATVAYIPAPSGGMADADALIVVPCTGCATGAQASAMNLGGYSLTSFSQPTLAVSFTSIAASRLDSGELLATFTVDWKPGVGGKMQIRYGGGPLSSGGILLKHESHPALACVTSSGGVVAVGSGC